MWDKLREWYYVLIEPLLVYFGLTTWGHGDPTYGRNALPYSPLEREAIYDNAAVKVTRRRVYLCEGKPVLDTALGEHITTVPYPWGAQVIDAWVNYYVWEMPHATQRMNADVYLVHGINDYSVRLASDAGKIMELVGRMLSTVAGRLPLLRAIKGKISDDPKVEYYAALDPQVYHGFVRIGTALAIVAGLDHVNEIVGHVRCPVAIHHGSHDRVTSPKGSQAFFARLNSESKSLPMLKSTPEMSVEDVERRNAVIQAIASWFLQLC
ncbi:acylglycerol lipase [Malassezia brasiliensis]|uniref:Acylglycerol lipase n=1 Tax=Malassezia brasiliensis TaxID=1821822 RepID=A0AAF0DPL2_9BASI|nr:acylglycerol lipase [Malassezia brasiliensis]